MVTNKKDKNTKYDLIWIIPEIIGSLGICYVALSHIGLLSGIGYSEWIFQLCLAMTVIISIGLPCFSMGMNELKKIIK